MYGMQRMVFELEMQFNTEGYNSAVTVPPFIYTQSEKNYVYQVGGEM